jgi:hypothetical protein
MAGNMCDPLLKETNSVSYQESNNEGGGSRARKDEGLREGRGEGRRD